MQSPALRTLIALIVCSLLYAQGRGLDNGCMISICVQTPSICCLITFSMTFAGSASEDGNDTSALLCSIGKLKLSSIWMVHDDWFHLNHAVITVRLMDWNCRFTSSWPSCSQARDGPYLHTAPFQLLDCWHISQAGL